MAGQMPHEIDPTAMTNMLMQSPPDSALGRYMRRYFGAYDFGGITLTPPTRTFRGHLRLALGDRSVDLVEVGPAHTEGDVIVHVPDAGVVFAGDILFYSGDWDARDRVARIDTNRCPLFMLTGEYDYSCTAEHSAATAAKIAGVHFQVMEGMGHFPFAENPKVFAGGDCINGGKEVVNAVADGRNAARTLIAQWSK